MTDSSVIRDWRSLQGEIAPGSVVVTSTGAGPFEQQLLDGRHVLKADEPAAVGGGDAGPGPYELLLMSLGACTSMTVKMYAARKSWPLEGVEVRLHHGKVYHRDCADCDNKNAMIDRIEGSLRLIGPLSDEQRGRLLEIADKCPVHRTLTSRIDIRTVLDPA
jgi:putative redox protein